MTITNHEKIKALKNWADVFEVSGLKELHVPAGGPNDQQGGDGLCLFRTKAGVEVRSVEFDNALLSYPKDFNASVQGQLRIEYLHRDVNNFKQFQITKFFGLCTAVNFTTILTFLTKDPLGFVPSSIGLENLQDRWADEPDYEGVVDDDLHELQCLCFTPGFQSKDDQISAIAKKCRNALI